MTFAQAPGDVVPYTIEWGDWLAPGDTITTSVWTVQNLTAPVQLTISATANTGGELPAGTRYYVVTAFDADGETTPSNEVSFTWAQANGQATLTWLPVPNALGYRVYAGTTAGAENAVLATISNPSITTFVDDGRETAEPGTPPTVNTAALGVTVAATPAPTISADSRSVTAFLQGGTDGVVYTVSSHITAASGTQGDVYITVSIQDVYIP